MSEKTLERSAELNQIIDQWVVAQRNGDAAYLTNLVTDDFVAIGPRGFLLTKAQWLDGFETGKLKYNYLNWSEPQIRTYGETAIVTGHVRQKTRFDGGPEMVIDLRVTTVFVKQQGAWKLAHAQYSPIVPQ